MSDAPVGHVAPAAALIDIAHSAPAGGVDNNALIAGIAQHHEVAGSDA